MLRLVFSEGLRFEWNQKKTGSPKNVEDPKNGNPL